MPGGNGADLTLNPVQEGLYICRVNAGEKYVFSGWAHVRLLRSADSGDLLNPPVRACFILHMSTRIRLSVRVSDCIAGSVMSFPSSVSGLCITQQPSAQVLSEGDTLYLECSAQANPPPQFQWYHNQQPLVKAMRQFIKVSHIHRLIYLSV